MEVFNGSETVTIKEEPIDTTSFPTDCGTTVNYGQFCSVQYAEGCPDGQPQADLVDPLLKTEPPDSSGACCSNAIKKEEVVEPVETDPLVNTYSTKCELICAAENVEHKEPQPTPSTSAASKAEDNFEFISVGAIKQEEPEWTSDTEPVHPNPLQETVKEDPEPTLQQDCGRDSRGTTEHLSSKKIPHTGKTPHYCLVCEKQFKTQSHLTIHTRVHTGEKPYSCWVCQKKFFTKAHLTTHTRIHTGEKPYSCGVCQKKFSDKSYLATHTRIHTGEKLYKCGVCKKRFNTQAHLTMHTRIHTGEKPYHCGVCIKQFKTQSHLKAHARIHTGQRPYHCKVCKKRFNTQWHLTAHSRIHTGEKPYHCRVCTKQFNTKSALTRHGRTHSQEPIT